MWIHSWAFSHLVLALRFICWHTQFVSPFHCFWTLCMCHVNSVWPVTTPTAHIHSNSAPLANYTNLAILFLFEALSICTGTAFWIYAFHEYSRTVYVLLQEHFSRPTLWNVSFSMTVAMVTCRYRITYSSWRIGTFLHSYSFPLFHIRHPTEVYFLIFLLRTLPCNIL